MDKYMKQIMRNIEIFETSREHYSALDRAATPLMKPSAPVIGREKELGDLRLALRNPEKANVIMLGEPGSGKSAIVQAFTYDENSTQYLTLSIDVERLAQDANGEKDMENGLLDLVSEASAFSKKHNLIVVLFIDEFHRIAMLSPSSMEALKPILEKSAHSGFRVIAATTFEEYDEWIAVNRALDQRMLRMDLPELPRDAVINILKSRAEQYGVDKFADESVFREIYDTSKQILISNSQPRASIDILLNMVGNITKNEYMKDGELIREYATPEELHINSEYTLSRPMLNRVIQRSYGIDIDNRVDIDSVRKALRSSIYNQEYALDIILSRLEMSLAGFNDPTRPKISFISTGPTGVGKALPDDEWIPVYSEGDTLFKRNGELVVGDKVFNKEGKPVNVTGVFPQGEQEAYEVTLSDGRTIICNDEHLWTYQSRSMRKRSSKNWNTASLRTLIDKGITNDRPDGRKEIKYFIPMNEAVERDVITNYPADPYVVGAMIGNGAMTSKVMEFSTSVEDIVSEVASLIGAKGYDRNSKNNYTWTFWNGEEHRNGKKRFYLADVFGDTFELNGLKSGDKYIPEQYKNGSIDQRWALIQGLFDTDGTIENDGYRYSVSYSTSSETLAYDIQEVLYSLGVSSYVSSYVRKNGAVDWVVRVRSSNDAKGRFFRTGHKKDIADTASTVVKERDRKYNTVGILSVKKLNKKLPMTCIMVDDEKHLYQAGRTYIVTHNTELAKVISDVLGTTLKRFDMSRYSRPEDAAQFADELARAAWSAPNAYILIDEVEKSTKQCMNILLQVLDDARLTSANNANRVISFSGNIINLTTNLASEVYQHNMRFSEQVKEGEKQTIDTELIYKALADDDTFETAVLGRLDAIVPFLGLPKHALAKIAQKSLDEGLAVAETNRRPIFISPDIIPYIVIDRTSKDTERGGARDTKRNVKNIVIQKIASYMAEKREEVPLIVRLDNTPRFRSERIGDPEAAGVMVEECHPMEYIDRVLAQLATKLGEPLENKGLFIPKTMEIRTFATDIASLYREGSRSFKTSVNITEVKIIDGEADIDIAGNKALLT